MRVNWHTVENGIPDHFFKMRYAVPFGVVVAVLGTFFMNGIVDLKMAMKEEPTVAPACVGAALATYTPGRAPVAESASKRRPSRDLLERFEDPQDSLSKCKPESCEGRFRDNFNYRMGQFITGYRDMLRLWDEQHGDAGLKALNKMFGEEDTIELQRRYREYYNAGVFRLAEFEGSEDMAISFLLKDPKTIVPCRAGT